MALEFELRIPPKPKPEKGDSGDAVGPAVKAIVPVDCDTVSEPRSLRSRMRRHAKTGESITLKGMQIAEIDCLGLVDASALSQSSQLGFVLTGGRRYR